MSKLKSTAFTKELSEFDFRWVSDTWQGFIKPMFFPIYLRDKGDNDSYKNYAMITRWQGKYENNHVGDKDIDIMFQEDMHYVLHLYCPYLEGGYKAFIVGDYRSLIEAMRDGYEAVTNPSMRIVFRQVKEEEEED